MFLYPSVILLTRGGGCYDVTRCYGQQHPQHPRSQTAPSPPAPRQHPAHPGQQARGTHPTGMLSCLIYFRYATLRLNNIKDKTQDIGLFPEKPAGCIDKLT